MSDQSSTEPIAADPLGGDGSAVADEVDLYQSMSADVNATADDEEAIYADDGDGVNTRFQVTASFVYVTGERTMPAGRPNGTGKKVVLGGASMLLHVKFTVERGGGPPPYPSPISPDPNCVLEWATVSPRNLDGTDSGTNNNFAVAGHYVYSFIDPTKVNMGSPIPPFLAFEGARVASLAALTRADQSIIDTIGSSGIVNPFTGSRSSSAGPGSGSTSGSSGPGGPPAVGP